MNGANSFHCARRFLDGARAVAIAVLIRGTMSVTTGGCGAAYPESLWRPLMLFHFSWGAAHRLLLVLPKQWHRRQQVSHQWW